MPVEITITHETADAALAELKALAAGFTSTPASPVTLVKEAAAKVREAVEAVAQSEPEPESEQPKKRGRKPKAEAEERQISTAPETRVGPEDDPEVEAQDAADEAAEVEAKQAAEPERTYTHDDVRAVLGEYLKKFGMDAAQADGPKIFKSVTGQDVKKVSDLPGEALKDVIDAIRQAIDTNTFGRTATA